MDFDLPTWSILPGAEQLSTPDHSLGSETDEGPIYIPKKRTRRGLSPKRRRKKPKIKSVSPAPSLPPPLPTTTQPVEPPPAAQDSEPEKPNPWLSEDEEVVRPRPRRPPPKPHKKSGVKKESASRPKPKASPPPPPPTASVDLGIVEISSSEDDDISSRKKPSTYSAKFVEKDGVCILLSEDEPPDLKPVDPFRDLVDPFTFAFSAPSPTPESSASFVAYPSSSPPTPNIVSGITLSFAKHLYMIGLTHLRRFPDTTIQKAALIDLVVDIVATQSTYRWAKK